jgi:hypothetical protein
MSSLFESKPHALHRIGVSCAFIFALLVPVSKTLGQDSDDKAPKVAVLVAPFENQSKQHENIVYEVAGSKPDKPKRRYTVDRFTEAPRSVFENMLVNIEGITIVERQRVDTMLVESEFGSKSGLVDPDKALKLGNMLGANLIVIGTILDLHDEDKEFAGYGVEIKNTDVVCAIRVRLLDETGTIRFNKIVKGAKQYSKSTFGRTKSSDRFFGAIEKTIQKLEGDSKFRAAILGQKPDKADGAASEGVVEVEFAPQPDNCDIEIDGKYVGGSPLKRRLPAGKELKVRIAKGGYKDWEGVIVPEKGMRITRELSPNR